MHVLSSTNTGAHLGWGGCFKGFLSICLMALITLIMLAATSQTLTQMTGNAYEHFS